MNKLFIQGADYTDHLTGLDDLEIEVGLNTSTNTIGKVLSTQITAKEAPYNILKDFFFNSCDSWVKSMKALFVADICDGFKIESEITSEGIEYFPQSNKIDFNLKSSDRVSKAYARLDSEYITENGFAEIKEIPIMYYVDQPNYMAWVLFLLTIPIRVVINAIDAVLGTICSVIDAIPGVSLDCDDILSGPIFSTFDTWIIGTGRWTVTPLIREMISYQCDQVGLKFVSSIVNSPDSIRYNLSLFCLTGGDNGDYNNTSKPERVRVLEANKPLYTTISLLQELSEAFAADYRIIGDTLYFEPLDYFDSLRTNRIFNINDICQDDDDGYSITYNTENAYAYGEYSYVQDAMDQDGNKTLKIHYQDKVEYNLPYNPAQKGKKTRSLNFGCARFMFDQYAFNNNGFFNFNVKMDEFRDGPDSLLSEVFFDNEGVVRHFDIVVSSSQLSNNKLLVLENNFDRNDAKTIKIAYQKKGKKQYWIYNHPMHIKEDASYSELVKDYLIKDNPRTKKDKFKMSDLEIKCECDYVGAIVNDFQRIYIETPHGKAYPESAVIQMSKSEVTINFTGIRVIC